MRHNRNPKPPYPPQFRQQMVELVIAGRKPSELAKEFGCHETSIMRLAHIRGGQPQAWLHGHHHP
jgi:transposase